MILIWGKIAASEETAIKGDIIQISTYSIL
jgi:hypothetical protein